jgi:hypothetical protein
MTSVKKRHFIIRFWLLWFLAVLATALSGCSSQKKFVSVPHAFEIPSYTPSQVDTVVVLPVLDSRFDKSLKIDSAKRIQGSIEQFLTKNGYGVVVLKDEVVLKPILPQRLALPTPEWLATLGPTDSRWILLIELTGTQYKRDRGGSWFSIFYGGLHLHIRSTRVELTAYLFDKQNMTRPWKKQVLANAEIVDSILTLLYYAKEDRLLLENAATQAVRDLPTRNVKKRPRS